MDIKLILEFFVILGALAMGARAGGVGLGLWGAVGLARARRDANDAPLGAGNDVISRIASVVIKGGILATPAPDDRYGIIAQEIGSFKVGAYRIPLLKSSANDSAALSADTLLRELPVVT